jgi:hypothetical protein
MYYKFLNGEIDLSEKDNENNMIDINDIFDLNENYNKYTLFDSNHNGIPELHLSSMREYIIIECDDNELEVIYSGTGYETLLNNGAILYSRSGGGPTHTTYEYTELEAGNISTVNFSKYSTDNDDATDDLYLFEDIEVSKDDFDEKTKEYLNVGMEDILWSDYWTFLLENSN